MPFYGFWKVAHFSSNTADNGQQPDTGEVYAPSSSGAAGEVDGCIVRSGRLRPLSATSQNYQFRRRRSNPVSDVFTTPNRKSRDHDPRSTQRERLLLFVGETAASNWPAGCRLECALRQMIPLGCRAVFVRRGSGGLVQPVQERGDPLLCVSKIVWKVSVMPLWLPCKRFCRLQVFSINIRKGTSTRNFWGSTKCSPFPSS